MSDMIMGLGTFEPENINLMGRLLRPGYKMLNLGAHAGLEAMIAANIVGDHGHLYVFEPSNFSNYIVTKGFELNNLSNRATIFKVALSDVKKKSKLYINNGNTGANMV
jgi:FkbM family methyltransferase